MYAQVERLNRTEGEIDNLQHRLAEIRTWTYAANRGDWLQNAETWRGRTREIEDRLSDALHQALMSRFVDRRTSALLKHLNSTEEPPAEIGPAGEISIGGHLVGKLDGLVFHAEARRDAGRTRPARTPPKLAPPDHRAPPRVHRAGPGHRPHLRRHELHHPPRRLPRRRSWLRAQTGTAPASTSSARETPPPPTATTPSNASRAGLLITSGPRSLHSRLSAKRSTGKTCAAAARGAAFQLLETGAAFDRRHSGPAFNLTTEDRAALNLAGVKTGRVATWLPGLLKPAAARLVLALRAVHSGRPAPEPPTQSSFPLKDARWTDPMLLTAGYLRLGPVPSAPDLAERLAGTLSQIRRGSETSAFAVPPELAAQVGCPTADFPAILRALGLKPAEKDKETGAVELWRFPAQRSPAPAPSSRNSPCARVRLPPGPSRRSRISSSRTSPPGLNRSSAAAGSNGALHRPRTKGGSLRRQVETGRVPLARALLQGAHLRHRGDRTLRGPHRTRRAGPPHRQAGNARRARRHTGLQGPRRSEAGANSRPAGTTRPPGRSRTASSGSPGSPVVVSEAE